MILLLKWMTLVKILPGILKDSLTTLARIIGEIFKDPVPWSLKFFKDSLRSLKDLCRNLEVLEGVLNIRIFEQSLSNLGKSSRVFNEPFRIL